MKATRHFIRTFILLILCLFFLQSFAAARDGDKHAVFAEDIAQTNWFYDAVDSVMNAGIMSGTSAATFKPNDGTTRAMFVTILYRIDGNPYVRYESVFADVLSGCFYSEAVTWAYQNGILDGIGGLNFYPDREITRQEVARLMYCYAAYLGGSSGESANLIQFHDYQMVSVLAVRAMQWAVGSGIIVGDDRGYLNPAKNLTRAETAVLAMRLINYLKLEPDAGTEQDQVSTGTHTPYCTITNGAFRPYDALTGKECAEMLHTLYGAVSVVESSDKAITLHEFYKAVCMASGNSAKAAAVFKGLNTAAAEKVSRLEAVTLLNDITDRSADHQKTMTGTVVTDVPIGTLAYDEVVEAIVPHTAVASGSTEKWTSDDIRNHVIRSGVIHKNGAAYLQDVHGNAVRTPGIVEQNGSYYLVIDSTGRIYADYALHVVDGKVVFAGTDGKLLCSGDYGGMHFDRNGFYTSGDTTLDSEVKQVISSCTTTNMTQMEKLRACYDYVRGLKYLGRNAALSADYKTFTNELAISYARTMFETGKGDCYNFAAAFCCLARGLGFEANSVVGQCLYFWNSVAIAHGWVEIRINGETWLFDPQIENYNNRNGISNAAYGAFQVTYDTAPATYYKN